jgi:hypothetical protein
MLDQDIDVLPETVVERLRERIATIPAKQWQAH